MDLQGEAPFAFAQPVAHSPAKLGMIINHKQAHYWGRKQPPALPLHKRWRNSGGELRPGAGARLPQGLCCLEEPLCSTEAQQGQSQRAALVPS